MAGGNWRHGGQTQPETGINQVLATYASRGGELLGARRWAENPLTLTHVRWQDGSGYILEAIRRPDVDLYLSEAERNIWVQLALHFPMTQPAATDSSAPWLPLTLQPAEAADLVNQLQRSRSSGGAPGGGWQGNPPTPPPPEPPHIGNTHQPPHAPRQPQQSGVNSWSPRESTPSGPVMSPRGGTEPPGTWNSYGEAPEVSAIPCVEIELPPLLTEPAAAEAAREFTKDVAAHFKRAAFSIPQTREVRGWMRTGRLVLAARVVVAMGTRAPSQPEMEHTAYQLADALARRTIPYSRMAFAEPNEWAQGVALPD